VVRTEQPTRPPNPWQAGGDIACTFMRVNARTISDQTVSCPNKMNSTCPLPNTRKRYFRCCMLFAFTCGSALAAISDQQASMVALGARLFSEQSLSADNNTSCASCHIPDLAFSDGKAVARGTGGKFGSSNTPSLIGLIDQSPMFWDGRQSQLQQLILEPLLNAREHGLPDLAALDQRLTALRYLPRTASSEIAHGEFPNVQLATAAIAQFLHSLQLEKSTLLRITQAVGNDSHDTSESRGAALFSGRAGCAACHRLEADATGLTDLAFHDHGIAQSALANRLPEILEGWHAERALNRALIGPSTTETSALGRYRVTGAPSDIGKFKTPSLFNVAVTAPYMHDGSIKTLHEAVAHEIYYSAPDKGAGLDLEDRRALVMFLRSLTDERFEKLLSDPE